MVAKLDPQNNTDGTFLFGGVPRKGIRIGVFLSFQAEWIDRREYWNDKMQRRYEKRRQDTWSKVRALYILVLGY